MGKRESILRSRTGAYWLMVLPALVWMVMFNIVPMFGIVMAFQDFNPGKGILGSKFVWLENFEYMFQMKDVSQIFINTIVIAVGKLLLNVFVPNAGFDQIYNIYNQAVYSTGDIIDTWVYRVGLHDLQYSLPPLAC